MNYFYNCNTEYHYLSGALFYFVSNAVMRRNFVTSMRKDRNPMRSRENY